MLNRGPNIFVQGLILALLPVFIQFVMVAFLIVKLQEAEAEVAKETHYKVVLASAHTLVHKFYQAGAMLHLCRSNKDDWVLEKYRSNSESIEKELRLMKKMVADNPDELAQFEEMARSTREAKTSLQNAFEMVEQGMSIRDEGPQIQFSLRQLLNALNRFIKFEEGESLKHPSNTERSRQAVFTCLIGGSLANLLIGIGLLILFNRGTVKRLRSIVDNTDRLKRNQALLPEIEGTDEISTLDRTFHDMAASLAEAAKHKQELMQMVSHDLKTPLTSVQFTLSALADGVHGELPEQAIREIQLSEYNATRLIHLIRDLLDIERLEAGKLEVNPDSFRLQEFFDESIGAVSAYAKKREIEIKRPETDAKINADSDRLHQVMVNLLSNAIKFSPKKSTIEIAIDESNEWTEIKVIDSGRGIPAEHLDSVFERFRQVKSEDASQHHGSGLGLAISKAIVEAHNGQIGVKSKEGEGSTFWFKIPNT